VADLEKKVFKHFRRKFAILVAPPTDVTTTRLMHCKVHLIL